MSLHLFWFRRDLRTTDNAGLYHAAKDGAAVQCVFIFDTEILDKLEQRDDARVTFIHDTLSQLHATLMQSGGKLDVRFGNPIDVWPALLNEYNPSAVYSNRDYEPYALQRDKEVHSICEKSGIAFRQFKDHVLYEMNEVVKPDGKPYTVFTPYKKRWLDRLGQPDSDTFESAFRSFESHELLMGKLFQAEKSNETMLTLADIGFERSKASIPSNVVSQAIVANYDKNRDFPAVAGTSMLGIHFRFGTISVREKARKAWQLNATYLSELIWRDFYAMILSHFPYVASNAFRREYDEIRWRNNEEEFAAWCQGMTGYPIVDAGMRQLKATGYMHNRVRMITASFLTKHLLIDWRWGEAWFAAHLLDFDLASNNGGWQWAAGCGTDAAPYFRIFNPTSQTEKFDKDQRYIKQWVPEVDTALYPKPIVDHSLARERCLRVYKEGLAASKG